MKKFIIDFLGFAFFTFAPLATLILLTGGGY